MKSIFKAGDTKTFERTVRPEDSASFEGTHVHPVYATFGLTRDAEWCSRLFVLEMKEENEEGIGTFVDVKHLSPALIGETVRFEATIEEISGNAVNCSFIARVNDRTIATGKTGQKVLLKSKLEELFNGLTGKM
ncbi:MAG: hypothetical protein IPN22_08660 [Bacteroidetes bacterium]|nr:hypothetical protein [Bacteroidota bacterium]